MSQQSLTSHFTLFSSLTHYPTLYPPTKHLTKFHPSTRTKALQTIIAEFPKQLAYQEHGDDAIPVLLHSNTMWDFLSVIKLRLSLDSSRQIRLLSWQLLGTLISLHPQVKQAFLDMEDRYLEYIIANWFLAMHDTDTEIQKYTRQLFQECLAPKYQLKVLNRYKHEILALMMQYFNQSVHGMMMMLKNTDQDEAEDTFARFITMSLSALRTMIARLSTLQSEDEQLTLLLSNKHFWKFLIIEKFPTIRVAAFQLVGTVCEIAPQLLAPHIKIMAPLVLSCFQEADPMVQQYTMEALIIFLQKFPQAWDYVNVWKDVFPKLFQFLHNASTSFPSKTYSILLPFVSMLNFNILGASNGQSERFFDNYFESMWHGYLQEETQDFDRNFIVSAYVESIMFVTMRAERYVAQGDEKAVHSLQSILLRHFMRAMEWYLTSPDKVPDAQHFATQIIALLSKFQSRTQTHESLRNIWKGMWEVSERVLSQGGANEKHVFVQRLDLLLSQLRDSNENLLQSSEQNSNMLREFAQPLMNLALDLCTSSGEQDASLYLDVTVILCDAIPLQQLGANNDGTFSSQSFFESRVEPIFQHFHCAAATSHETCEALCDFLSHYFETCPHEFARLESLIQTEDLSPVVLYHIILKCFSVFVGETLQSSTSVESLVDRIVSEIEALMREDPSAPAIDDSNVEQNAQFMELVLIQFPGSLSETFLSSTIVRLVQCLHAYIKLPLPLRRSYRGHVSHILSLLEPLCRTLIGLLSEQQDELLNLSAAIFALCVYEESAHLNYVTRAFWNECATNGMVDADGWELQYTLGEGASQSPTAGDLSIDAQARRVWRSVVSYIASESSATVPLVVNNAVQYLQSRLQSAHTTQQVSHRPVVATMQLLDSVSRQHNVEHSSTLTEHSSTLTDHSTTLTAFVLNHSLWQQFRSQFDESTICMQVDGKSFLVTKDASQDPQNTHTQHSKFQSVFNYSRFIMTLITFLQQAFTDQQFQSIFLDDSSLPTSNVWLFYQIYYANERNSLFHYKVRQSLTELRDRIQLLIWSVPDQHWMPCIKQTLQALIKLCTAHQPRTEAIFVGHFIRDTLEHLHNRSKSDRKMATEHMDSLLDYCLEHILFPKSFEETLQDSIHCILFDVVIESLFEFIDENVTTFVNDHLNRRIIMSDSYYETIMEWLSKSVSILLSKTLDVVQENLTPDDMIQLYNLLSLQASLTLLNNFMRQIETEENRVSTGELVRVLSDFTTSMMDSYDYCAWLPQVEHLVAKMLGIIYKSIAKGEVSLALGDDREDHDAFVATFFQQHALVVLSSFDKRESAFDDVRVRLQNFAVMEAMASAFLEKRTETRAAVEIARLLYHSMTTFFALEKESIESKRNLTFYAIITRLQQKVCTSLLFVTERIYTILDKEAKRHMSKQMIQVLRSSRHAHAQLAAGHSLRSHENLSNILVEKKGSATSEAQGLAQQQYELDPQFSDLLHQCPIEISPKLTESSIIEFSTGELYATQHHELFSYLLAWDVLCKLSDKSSKELKSVAFVAIKTKQSFHLLLNLLFSFVLHTSHIQQENPSMDQLYAPYITFDDISKDDASVALGLTHDGFTLFAAQLILKMVHTFPSLVMTWYKSSAMSASVNKALTDFISQRLAPPVIEKELLKIQTRSKESDHPEHVKINVLKNIGRIRCIYTQDDIELEVVLEIPSTYPLKAIEMKSHKRTGVSEATWRKVLLKMTTMLFKDAGNIYDSIQLWVENLDKHFSGYEPCPICYSILTLESTLPDKKCSQCKQMFHSSCLVKWFQSSPEPTCPYCRGLHTFH